MAIEVFSRYEKKYMMNSAVYLKIQDVLRKYMNADPYNKDGAFYTISNIYYDTPDNYLIRNSTMKPAYKEKLRLRAYGVPKEEDLIFLEIKKKFQKIVNKRRTKLSLKEAYSFVENGEKPALQEYMNPQVLNELEYFIRRYPLKPKLYLAYDRFAYFGEGQRDLRISFDTNIRTRRDQLRLEKGDFGELLLDDNLWLMEIKAEKAIPVWVGEMLSEYEIFPVSFSKYGTEYQKYLAKNVREERIPCLISCLSQQAMPNYQLALQY